MTASEPPAKWYADIRGDDDVHVVCRVEEGRVAAARMRRRENQGKHKGTPGGTYVGPSGSSAASNNMQQQGFFVILLLFFCMTQETARRLPLCCYTRKGSDQDQSQQKKKYNF